MSKHNCGIIPLLEVRLIEVLRYPIGTTLAGVIFFHRFTSFNGQPGQSLCQNIKALKELCGDTTLKNVVIMTHPWKLDSPEAKQKLNKELSPRGCFYPAIEQGARVYHCTRSSKPDLGALRIILRGRPVIPRDQQEPINEGNGPERIAPATELSKEIPKLAERNDSDVKELEVKMQEVMGKKIEELRRELEEQNRRAREEANVFKKQIDEMQSKEETARKEMVREHLQELEERGERERRAREEADGLRKRIAEMQSKLEDDRRGFGKTPTTYNFRHIPARSRVFLVRSRAHLALQRLYPLTDLRPNLPLVLTTHFTARTMNDVSKTSGRMTSSGSLTI